MKYIFLLLLVIGVFLTQAHGQTSKPSIKALDEKYGFRDARFEAPFSSFKDMVPFDEQEVGAGDSYYSRSTDEMKIGNAQLKQILYVFHNGKLSAVFIVIEGTANSKAVLAALQAQYGTGYKKMYQEHYTWSGSKMIMVYNENSISGDATVLMSSNEMRKQQKTDEKQAAKKAASDL